MAIYWFGTEDIDFPNGTLPSNDTSGLNRSHLRCAIFKENNSIYMHGTQFAVGEITSGWLHYYHGDEYIATNEILNSLEAGLGLLGDNKGIYVGNHQRNARIVLYDGSTQTVLDTSDDPVLTAGVAVDLQVIDYGATGTINLYVAGALVCTYTGDIQISGVTGFDHVVIRGNAYHPTGFADRHNAYSEIIVADQDTRSLSLVDLYPTAAGSTNSWVGAYTAVDEITNSDADFIYSDTAGLTFQCNLYNQTAFSVSGVSAAKVVVRGYASTDSTIKSCALGIQSGSTISVTAAVSFTDSWQTYEHYMTVNPVTANSFQLAELDDLQITLVSDT